MWIKILFIILVCSITHLAIADVYVITDKTNAVYSISDQNDAILPAGDTLTVLKGQNIVNLPISGSPQLYTFNKGGFTLNATAVQAQQDAQKAAIANQKAALQAKESAIAKLTDALSKVNVNDVLTEQEMNALLPS